ncbi:hypothetical protein K438DRAFT_1795081 [Mycena galopus ATCC 62051]|nr:hypothetical protein K438DRAFT_1795081 [Mycena galopus ATCC 62051]
MCIMNVLLLQFARLAGIVTNGRTCGRGEIQFSNLKVKEYLNRLNLAFQSRYCIAYDPVDPSQQTPYGDPRNIHGLSKYL